MKFCFIVIVTSMIALLTSLNLLLGAKSKGVANSLEIGIVAVAGETDLAKQTWQISY